MSDGGKQHQCPEILLSRLTSGFGVERILVMVAHSTNTVFHAPECAAYYAKFRSTALQHFPKFHCVALKVVCPSDECHNYCRKIPQLSNNWGNRLLHVARLQQNNINKNIRIAHMVNCSVEAEALRAAKSWPWRPQTITITATIHDGHETAVCGRHGQFCGRHGLWPSLSNPVESEVPRAGCGLLQRQGVRLVID